MTALRSSTAQRQLKPTVSLPFPYRSRRIIASALNSHRPIPRQLSSSHSQHVPLPDRQKPSHPHHHPHRRSSRLPRPVHAQTRRTCRLPLSIHETSRRSRASWKAGVASRRGFRLPTRYKARWTTAQRLAVSEGTRGDTGVPEYHDTCIVRHPCDRTDRPSACTRTPKARMRHVRTTNGLRNRWCRFEWTISRFWKA